MKQLRDYQEMNSKKGAEILKRLNIVYLAMEVRSGKTGTALSICKINDYKNVLFLTKKKAIDGILQDYADFRFTEFFKLTVINNESLHLIKNNDFDCVVMDEAHRCMLGSTLIDGVKIKDINLGYSLICFNFEKKEYELKKVKKVYKNSLNENLVKIKCNGKEIICTESHEIFTKRGWVKARDITLDDELQVVL